MAFFKKGTKRAPTVARQSSATLSDDEFVEDWIARLDAGEYPSFQMLKRKKSLPYDQQARIGDASQAGSS